MILKNCHVENFGKINNLDLDFSSGLNSFCEQNGYGKSTISTFLKVMFYGMKTSSKNGAFTDRAHYYPFNGGKFGGSLTFENDGHVYRIERFFDVKSETKDTFKLYKDGSESSAYSENIGEEVFGLDETSFKKTVFFGEVYEEVCATSTINARLNNVVYDMGDGGYEKAVFILDKSRKFYKLDRGTSGELFNLKSQINNVKKEIERLKAIENVLPYKYQEIKDLTLKANELEQKAERLQTQKVANSKKAHYDKLLQFASDEKKKADDLLAKYNGKFLDDGEQAVLREVDSKLKELNGEKKAVTFSQEKKEKLQSLNSSLKDLTMDKLERVENKYLELQSAQQKPRKTSLLVPAIISFSLGVILTIVLMSLNISVGFIAGIIGVIAGGILLFIDNKNNKLQKGENGKKEQELYKIYEFLSQYGESGQNAKESIDNLKRAISNYNSLYIEMKDSEQKLQDIEREISKISVKSQVILARYGQIDDALSFIMLSNNAKSQYELALKNSVKYKEEAQKFYDENSLNGESVEEFEDEESLKTQLSWAKNTLTLKNKEFNGLELEVDGLGDCYSQLEKLEERLNKATFNHECLVKTLEILTASSKRLNDKYVEPIKQKFLEYSKKIEQSLGEKVFMDKNYKVSFERGGEIRSDKHLSAGQRAIVDLCLRLSLIDNVFTKTSPFILLDDSFCLLDENHFESVKKVVKELSKDKQILYFTCHKSRTI